jgi:hypothetical protein
VCLAVAAVTAACVPGIPSAGAANAQQREPSPEELWDAYPLEPEAERTEEAAPPGTTGRAGAPGADASPTPSATATRAPVSPRATDDEDGGLPAVALAAAVIAAFASGLIAGRIRRRRRLAAGSAATPPAPTDATARPIEPAAARPAAAPTARPIEPAAAPAAAAQPEPAAPEPARAEPAPPAATTRGPAEPAIAPEPKLEEDEPNPDVEDAGWFPPRRFVRAPWPEATELWSCEIAWKPGYVKSCFRAMAARPGGKRRHSIGESPPLRWTLMMDPEPPTPEMVEAVGELVAALEAAGWERMDADDGPWYALRFLWHGEVPPQRVEIPGRKALNGTEDRDE